MNRTRWLVIIVAAGLTAGGLFVFKTQAVERAAGKRPLRGQWGERAREKLGLTDEQVAQIKTELKDEVETVKGLISRLHEARMGVREAIHSSGATETSVRAAAAKVAAVEADLAVERLKLYGKISPILTAEQRDKVKQFQSRIDDLVDRAVGRLGERLSAP